MQKKVVFGFGQLVACLFVCLVDWSVVDSTKRLSWSSFGFVSKTS